MATISHTTHTFTDFTAQIDDLVETSKQFGNAHFTHARAVSAGQCPPFNCQCHTAQLARTLADDLAAQRLAVLNAYARR